MSTMPKTGSPGAKIVGPAVRDLDRVLTAPAMAFLAALERKFRVRRQGLLARRARRQQDLDRGATLDFLPETRAVRAADWRVAPAPFDLQDRRVEITGPAEPKMMINALNSGAKVFMADFEDALSPTWANVIKGQASCQDAVRRTLHYQSPEGKRYELGDALATLVVRPRGWHLPERHLELDGEPMSASFVDFGLYCFHNARTLLARQSGPYFYLPKLENHLEARLWNDVFNFTQEALGIPAGTIRATVLIETITAALEMEEILYELRDHASGLNAGRWDYIFSIIKKFQAEPGFCFPDRSRISMSAPFMQAYCDLLVQTCHRRGAHAIGGMAAFIHSRANPEINAIAIAHVVADKEREARAGFDGTWVAHPDLVPVARAEFDRVLGAEPHQKHQLRADVRVEAHDLTDFCIPGGTMTGAGLRKNINVALRYLDSWLAGTGAAALDNLMEDAATAEISRAQLWQWIHHQAVLDRDGAPSAGSGSRRQAGPAPSGRASGTGVGQREAGRASGEVVTVERFRQVCRQELELLGPGLGNLEQAARLLDILATRTAFVEFLTLSAYDVLVANEAALGD